MSEQVLVDTSVWVSHFRFSEDRLVMMLDEEDVACHPYIIGELACGTMKNRVEILDLLRSLPMVKTTTQEEILFFIDENKLMGQGLGYIDVHLLSSAVLSDIPIWTLDKYLAKAASRLGVGRY